ncbi:MAG: ATP-binding protein [Campylobacterota bacterium]|nr:ATP-binding protein [Campylobacterota bacterium]
MPNSHFVIAKNPQKYYIQSHSKIGRFLSETDIQSSDIIEGNLIDQVDLIMNILRLKYLKAYISYEGMHRREKLEYPYEALREAVIIERFDKPHQSKPFNPTIASVFYKCGFIENWGKGTLNIISDCLAYGLPRPTFEYEWTAVRTTFYKRKTREETDGGINGGINELYELIQKNPTIKAVEIKKRLNITQRTLERYLKQLKDEEKIKFIGSKKTGGYAVK